MNVVTILRNAVVVAIAGWAIFGILHMLSEGGGRDGLAQLSDLFWFIAVGSLVSLAAFALERFLATRRTN
jgi:hypothetical protein